MFYFKSGLPGNNSPNATLKTQKALLYFFKLNCIAFSVPVEQVVPRREALPGVPLRHQGDRGGGGGHPRAGAGPGARLAGGDWAEQIRARGAGEGIRGRGRD